MNGPKQMIDTHRSLITAKIAFGLLLLSCLMTMGCQPIPPNSGTTNPDVKSGGSGKGPFTAEGTVSGGGGNGLDGVVIERYSKRIEELPEYMRFIEPALRRLGKDEPDVLLMYLKWAAKHKSWYFVPAALPELPKDRTQLAFQSDQLALHSDQEIFINDLSYREKSSKDRAYLLMHEMVMAARLLMKKSPETQCAALSHESRLKCKDPEFVKIAKRSSAASIDDSKPVLLNGVDHEAVRSMTSFLMEGSQSLTRIQVAATRTNLQFVFPWDDVVSYFTAYDIKPALDRFMLSGRKLRDASTDENANPENTAEHLCTFSRSDWGDEWSGITIGSRGILSQWLKIVSGTYLMSTVGGYHSGALLHLSFSKNRLHNTGPVDIRGSLDESVSSEIVDIVTLGNDFQMKFEDTPTQYFHQRTELFFSREEAPRLLQVKASLLRALPPKEGDYGPRANEDLVKDESLPVVICN